jgi:hypothetical protein
MIVLGTELYLQYNYGVVDDKEVTVVTVIMRNPITAILVNNEIDALFSMYLFHFSTCFE